MNTEHAHRFVATYFMPIRWGDMDAMGHVNNTVYFRYMEQARIEWMAQIGYGLDVREEGPVIANASCNYRQPLTYPGDVEVKLFLGAPGRSSIPTYYEMRRRGSTVLCADGAAKLVWISSQSGRSIPLPDAMRAAALNKPD
jgi:acyl-CoA thioester hydrolase